MALTHCFKLEVFLHYINRVIQQKIKQNGHAANVTISANTNTLKAVLILENNYHVDFRTDHPICSLLGFNHAVYTSDYLPGV